MSQGRKTFDAEEDYPEETSGTLSSEDLDDRAMHPSALRLHPNVFLHKGVGPLDSGLPVGTYGPDDEFADPEATTEESMRSRRIVCVNFDDDGSILSLHAGLLYAQL
jgi:hypothetical protein